MTDLPVQLVRLTKRIACLEKKVRDDEIGQYSAHSLKEYFDDEMSEEMKAVADKYIDLEERIEICEGNIENLDYRLEEIERKVGNILIALRYSEKLGEFEHLGKDFCGNCIHHVIDDDIPCCELTAEICDHDDASCSMYQDSYADTDSTTKEVRNAAKAKLNSLYGKPDREECKHCPKSQCDNCMNFSF